MSHQIHTYTELQQQIHDDLRIQHPEWVDPNGESPKCDSVPRRVSCNSSILSREGDPTSLSLLLITPPTKD